MLKKYMWPAKASSPSGKILRPPGFLRCIVTTRVAGRAYRGLATAAFAPEKITPTQVEPADFDAFWQAGKDELAKTPMEARVTLLGLAALDGDGEAVFDRAMAARLAEVGMRVAALTPDRFADWLCGVIR